MPQAVRIVFFVMVFAAVFSAGANAVLSHRSAALLWGLLKDSRSVIDVTTPDRGRTSKKRVRVHRVRSLRTDDVALVDNIPVTSVARTLYDLARTESPRQLRYALDQAERLRLLDVRQLERFRCKALRDALAEMTEPANTNPGIERLFLEVIEAAYLFSLTPGHDAPIEALGVSPDSVSRFLGILGSRYALPATGQTGDFTRVGDALSTLARVDYTLSDRQTLTVRGLYNRSTQDNARIGFLDTRQNGGEAGSTSYGGIATLTSRFGQSWINELRGQYAKEDQLIESLDPNCGGPCGSNNFAGGPTLEITGVASVGRQRFTPCSTGTQPIPTRSRCTTTSRRGPSSSAPS